MAYALAVLGTAAAVLALSLAPVVESALAEVPLQYHSNMSLFVAEVKVGTPAQNMRVIVDSVSEWMWLPKANGSNSTGFRFNKSSTAKFVDDGDVGGDKPFKFISGLVVTGKMMKDTIELGGISLEQMPMILAENTSRSNDSKDGVGLLGLLCPGGEGKKTSWSLFGDSGSKDSADKPGLDWRGSFCDEFWAQVGGQASGVRKVFQLEFGGTQPRILIGDRADEGESSDGGEVQYLSTHFTSRSPSWYVSMRAIALSMGRGEKPYASWNYDFNGIGFSYGAPVLLDTGVAGIRFSTSLFQQLVRNLPGHCKIGEEPLVCECKSTWKDDFPAISISFESISTFRGLLGLDSGADVIVCIPPEAYVTSVDTKKKQCRVAIVDGGTRHTMFNYPAVVLGVPFFRSVTVLLDAEKHRVGIGRQLQVVVNSSGSDSALATSSDEDEFSSGFGSITATSLVSQDQQQQCRCADPKNWWTVDKRFSPKRVVVALSCVAALAAYIFIAHSPSVIAVRVREVFEGFCGGSGGAVPAGGQALGGGPPGALPGGMAGGGQRLANDATRPFIEMPNRHGQE